jgi:hypothetical protein
MPDQSLATVVIELGLMLGLCVVAVWIIGITESRR